MDPTVLASNGQGSRSDRHVLDPCTTGRDDLINKVTLEQRFEGDEGIGQEIPGRSGRGNSQGKGAS